MKTGRLIGVAVSRLVLLFDSFAAMIDDEPYGQIAHDKSEDAKPAPSQQSVGSIDAKQRDVAEKDSKKACWSEEKR
jgi:hypothetical protein